jgi:hypothetical protein
LLQSDRPSVRLLHEDDNCHLENGELDYKKVIFGVLDFYTYADGNIFQLYEESRLENEKILGRLRRLEDEQKDASAVRVSDHQHRFKKTIRACCTLISAWEHVNNVRD